MKRIYSLDEFGVKKHDLVLENGLKVIFIEKPFAPIYARMTIRAGSVYENPSKGLAHFSEHMIMSASKNYPNKEDFAGIMASIGAYSNANTGRTALNVEAEIAIPEHLQQMKVFFSEALTNVFVTDDSLVREKGVIVSEINNYLSNPVEMSNYFYLEKLGCGTNWGERIIGTATSVTSITQQEVENFFATYCGVENMVLIIAGGCNVDDVRKTFSDIEFLPCKKVILPPGPSIIGPQQRIFYQQNLEKTNIRVFFKSAQIGSRDSYLLRLALSLAHSGFTSRFYRKLRNERGLVYSLSNPNTDFNKLRYTGTYTDTSPENIDSTIETILECYKEFVAEGITQKEIDDKIDTIWFTDKRIIESSYNWVEKFTELYPENISVIGDFPNWYHYMSKVSAEEIHDVIRRYITLDNYHLMISGREPSKIYS